MNNIVYLSDRIGKWSESFRHHDVVNGTMISVWLNDTTKDIDVVQTNDDGEAITTHLSGDHAALFVSMLALKIFPEKK